jgi:hypothetical protein
MSIRRYWWWLFIGPAALVGLALFVAIGGGIVMLLWNWLFPPLFGWPTITFWQGLGLLALCRILFGGFGGRGRGHFKHMAPGDRERFRQRMRERFWSRSDESQLL